MKEIEFLTLAEVVELHASRIDQYGGSHGIRDLGLLKSALSMPEASFDGQYLHDDLFEMAAAYAYHITQNHAFIDGNKRVALGAALLFLLLNGEIQLHDPKGKLYDIMMDVATGKMDKKQLALQFKRFSKKQT